MPMLRRSQSAAGAAQLMEDADSRRLFSITARPKLRQQLLNTTEVIQAEVLSKRFLLKYGYPPRPKQIEAAVNILNGRTAFLLAGTGFGKSRVPEMLYLAYDEKFAPIILCINPLDALGDDQVFEKDQVDMKAINLTAENCTQEACDSILAGDYTFVYVSPEVALTSRIFDRMWRDKRFQARLVLSVVDEAHMVYTWGLVESGQAKRLASHTRVQDTGVFRPSYGDLARGFLSTVRVPLLLMSATCTPQAIQAILRNLKLNIEDVNFCRAELSRPEIRFIRRAFKRPLKASLRGVFAHHQQVPTSSIPPTLLYSGTQNATLDYLQIINASRGQANETSNPFADFARRYHASTGPDTKPDAVASYVAGTLVVLCCTLALGLGQNWKQVRRVVVVGRQDPCNFIQMTGRCGRDGRRGLGILLVESNRQSGKNNIADFTSTTMMSDDDRMDALGITPVCLCIALAVDLQEGYIPLYIDHWAVIAEAKRQEEEGMRPCDCSNCKPEEAEALWLAQAALTSENFDRALQMDSAELLELVNNLPAPPPPPPTVPVPVGIRCGPDDPILTSTLLEALVTRFETTFIHLFLAKFPKQSDLGPRDFFGRDLAWDLAKNVDLFREPSDLAVVLASEIMPGQFDCLFRAFLEWKDHFNTSSTIKEAIAFREATIRPQGPVKPPPSVEGAALEKERSEQQKKALQEAKELAKLLAAQAKIQEHKQRAVAKANAIALKMAIRAKAVAERRSRPGALGQPSASPTVAGRPKRRPSTSLTSPPPKRMSTSNEQGGTPPWEITQVQHITPLLEAQNFPRTTVRLKLPT